MTAEPAAAPRDPALLTKAWERARTARAPWETLWRDCWAHALPRRRAGTSEPPRPAGAERLYDATAADAVDQLAAGLLSELTPPWGRWFALEPGDAVPAEEREAVAQALERASRALSAHFDRSNFAVEVHQCYLELVTAGTASLLFEEAPPGAASAFRFKAVPLDEVALEEGPSGRLDRTWRHSLLSPAELAARFPGATRPAESDGERPVPVVEAVLPEGGGYAYRAFRPDVEGGAAILAEGAFAVSPFVNFRWLKAPGETWGRSPLMKALPDVRTADKVVELILKNASIAVTGIWQADDDGVLNPATVRLVPGAIIPKAVGSSGLTPLDAPGRFDVSELVLGDLRARIRHALLVDRLGQVDDPRMTATEVLERSAEMARILGATYGRLQSELLVPLIDRALGILGRRGEIPDIRVDGRTIALVYRAPLAEAQRRRDAQTTLGWLQAAAGLGPEALQAVDVPAVVRWLGLTLGVPAELIRPAAPLVPEGLDADPFL